MVGFKDQPIQHLTKKPTVKSPIECFRCGGPHLANVCHHITSLSAGHVPKLVTLPGSIEASLLDITTLLNLMILVQDNRNSSLREELTLLRKMSLVRVEHPLTVLTVHTLC